MDSPTFFPVGSLLPYKHRFRKQRMSSRRVYPTFSPQDSDLSKLVWVGCGNNYGYATTSRVIDGKVYMILAHRIVLARMMGRHLTDGETGDHIFGRTLDNRRSELRILTHQQNVQNRGPQRNSKTRIRNVMFLKSRNCYNVHVTCGKRVHHVNVKTIDEAIAQAAAVRRAFGFPEGQSPFGKARKRHQPVTLLEQPASSQERPSYIPAPTGRTSPTPIDDAHYQCSVTDDDRAQGWASFELSPSSTKTEAAPSGVTDLSPPPARGE